MTPGSPEHLAEIERRKQALTCQCGARKRTAFFTFCDACLYRLPRVLRAEVLRDSKRARPNGEAEQQAVAWLNEHPRNCGEAQ